MHAKHNLQWRFQTGFFPVISIFFTGQTAVQVPQEVQSPVTLNILPSFVPRAPDRPPGRACPGLAGYGLPHTGTGRALPPDPAGATGPGRVSSGTAAIRCAAAGMVPVAECVFIVKTPYTASTVTAPTPCRIRKVIRGAPGRGEAVV